MTKIGQNYPFVLIVYEATSSSPSVVRSQVSLIVVTILTTVIRAQYQEYIIHGHVCRHWGGGGGREGGFGGLSPPPPRFSGSIHTICGDTCF